MKYADTLRPRLNPPHRRWWAGAGLLGLGLLSNLGSNVAQGDGSTFQCAAGSEALTAVLPSGPGLVGTAGAPLASPVQVRLVCTDSGSRRTILREGVAVEWAVQDNEGVVNEQTKATTATDQQGVSQALWRLGPTLGSQTLRVSAGSLSTTVQATALAPVAGDSCVAGSPGGTQFTDNRVVAQAETWTLAGSPYRGTTVLVSSGATLRIDPGVKVCVAAVSVEGTGRLLAEGTVEAPILWTAADLHQQWRELRFTLGSGNNVQRSVMRHVLADNLEVYGGNHVLLAEDSRFTVNPQLSTNKGCMTVQWGSGGQPSSFRRVVFDGYGGTSPGCGAAVQLNQPIEGPLSSSGPSTFGAQVLNSRANAVQVAGGSSALAWELQACVVTGSGGHGVVFDGTGTAVGARVSGCSLVANAGLGVNHLRPAVYTVNAQGNWWGDPAGPLASGGDGVSAGVDASAPLAAAPVAQ